MYVYMVLTRINNCDTFLSTTYSISCSTIPIYMKTSLMLSNCRTAWSTGRWNANPDNFSIVLKLSRNPVCIM